MVKKILYHGTENKREILEYGMNISDGLYGDGFYFYEKPSNARTYGSQIVKAEVVISKPFTFKSKQENETYNKLYEKYRSHRIVVEELKRRGYDAFRFKDFSKNSVGFWAWNIFNKSSIKKIS